MKNTRRKKLFNIPTSTFLHTVDGAYEYITGCDKTYNVPSGFKKEKLKIKEEVLNIRKNTVEKRISNFTSS